MRTFAACSTTVGDAFEGSSTPELIIDLARVTHDEAVTHYRVDPETCSYKGFAAERGERQAFADFLVEVQMPEDQQRMHLANWDGATRPVAVVHWFPFERPE